MDGCCFQLLAVQRSRMTRSKWFPAALFLISVGLALWWFQRSRSESPQAIEATPATRSLGDARQPMPPQRERIELVRAPEPITSVPDRVQPPIIASVEEAELPPPPPVLPTDPWELDGPRVSTNPSIFEARHAGRTLDELIVLRERCMQESTAALNAALDARMELGLFATLSPPRPVTQTSKSPLLRMHHMGDGSNPRIVWLPVQEYPEIYELSDEALWLMSKVNSMKAVAAGGGAK